MNKFNLSNYLMLSVVFIISGIAWVIFSQADNRFAGSDEFNSLKVEQDELLRQFYQLQSKYLTRENMLPSAIPQANSPAQTILQKNVSTNALPDDLPRVNRAWHNTQSDPADLLRNNPWNPDYQPAHIPVSPAF